MSFDWVYPNVEFLTWEIPELGQFSLTAKYLFYDKIRFFLNAIRKHVSVTPQILNVILNWDKTGFQTKKVSIMSPKVKFGNSFFISKLSLFRYLKVIRRYAGIFQAFQEEAARDIFVKAVLQEQWAVMCHLLSWA